MLNATPDKNVSARRGNENPVIARLSIEAYHKLNRASAVSQFVGGDLQRREMNGLHQLYIPQIFSYLHEDISFVLEELKAKGLCQEFLSQSGLSESHGGE
ncbi:Derepression protein [Buttiauxella ferragutiae]|uniref:Derepression protein n=1 Tax=Buttiauxella ferragutiae TaxID=82989 RepID=UPI001F52EF5F|nr:Derepression protein [Buttiauxella ferragutiae]UNK62348.1 Derepression protein [Buttiauxella ferragutiae]